MTQEYGLLTHLILQWNSSLLPYQTWYSLRCWKCLEDTAAGLKNSRQNAQNNLCGIADPQLLRCSECMPADSREAPPRNILMLTKLAFFHLKPHLTPRLLEGAIFWGKDSIRFAALHQIYRGIQAVFKSSKEQPTKNRLSTDVVVAPSLETLQAGQDGALSNLI